MCSLHGLYATLLLNRRVVTVMVVENGLGFGHGHGQSRSHGQVYGHDHDPTVKRNAFLAENEK